MLETIQCDENSSTEYMFLFSFFALFEIVTVKMTNIIIIVEINLLPFRIKQRLSGNKTEILKGMESFLTSNNSIDKILLHFQRCFSGSSFEHSWAFLYITFPIRKQSSSFIMSDQWWTWELFFMVAYFSFSGAAWPSQWVGICDSEKKN